jgi:hypothetical protein
MSVEREAPPARDAPFERDHRTGAPVGAEDPPATSPTGAAAPSAPTRGHPLLVRRAPSHMTREFKADNLTDWAPALTYYGVLVIFPAVSR